MAGKDSAALRKLKVDGEKVQQCFGYDRTSDPPKLKQGYETPIAAFITDYHKNCDLLRSTRSEFLPLIRWVNDYVRYDPKLSEFHEGKKQDIASRVDSGKINEQEGDLERHSLAIQIIDQHLNKVGDISAHLYFNLLTLLRDYHETRTSSKTDDPHKAFLGRLGQEIRNDNLDTIVQCLDRGFADNQTASTLRPFYEPLAKVIRAELKDMSDYALRARLRLEGQKKLIDAAKTTAEAKDLAYGLKVVYDMYSLMGGEYVTSKNHTQKIDDVLQIAGKDLLTKIKDAPFGTVVDIDDSDIAQLTSLNKPLSRVVEGALRNFKVLYGTYLQKKTAEDGVELTKQHDAHVDNLLGEKTRIVDRMKVAEGAIKTQQESSSRQLSEQKTDYERQLSEQEKDYERQLKEQKEMYEGRLKKSDERISELEQKVIGLQEANTKKDADYTELSGFRDKIGEMLADREGLVKEATRRMIEQGEKHNTALGVLEEQVRQANSKAEAAETEYLRKGMDLEAHRKQVNEETGEVWRKISERKKEVEAEGEKYKQQIAYCQRANLILEEGIAMNTKEMAEHARIRADLEEERVLLKRLQGLSLSSGDQNPAQT